MRDLLLIEEVDVRRTQDADDSRVLTITKMALPKLKRKQAAHSAGGGSGDVNYLLPQIEALEPTFSVKGLDAGTMAAFGFVPGASDRWTFAASVRDLATNKIVPLRATIQGVIAEWSPGEHSPGDVLDCDHSLQEVTYYELRVDDVQWFEWGRNPRVGRSFGVDWFAPYRLALGV